MLENLRASLANGGSATILTGGGADGAPVLSKLSPLELRARIKELESTYGFAKAKLRALEARTAAGPRSEEHTSELQSLMRISYAVFCLKNKNQLTLNDSKLT